MIRCGIGYLSGPHSVPPVSDVVGKVELYRVAAVSVVGYLQIPFDCRSVFADIAHLVISSGEYGATESVVRHVAFEIFSRIYRSAYYSHVNLGR